MDDNMSKIEIFNKNKWRETWYVHYLESTGV